MPTVLPFSNPRDLVANREARFSARQLIALFYSGVWRLLLGLPTAAAAATVAWNHDFWAMTIGLGLAGAGLYLSWRGFSFLGDTLTRNVAFVTGTLVRYKATSRGITFYYLEVGPEHRRISRHSYETLPPPTEFHAYYASGSQRLLSLEPATESEPHPALIFGGDASHAWDRVRWPLVVAAVGVFGLVAGIHGVVTAHAARTYMVSSTITGYEEHTGKAAYRHLLLADFSETYSLDYLDNYTPPIPYLGDYIGSRVDLYVNADTNGDVIALRLRERLYTGDYYLHPEDQTRDMVVSGALIAAISLAGLLLAIWWRPKTMSAVWAPRQRRASSARSSARDRR